MKSTEGQINEMPKMHTSTTSGQDKRIGTSVLQSILDTRIEQMRALTLPTDTNRQQILNEINKLPTFTKKLTSFLDFMIGQITSLSVDMNKFKSELISTNNQLSNIRTSQKESESSIDNRINHIADLLNVSQENIETKIESLLLQTQRINQKEDHDYEKCTLLLKCKEGKMEESIKLLLAENERLQRMVTQDRSLLLRQNEELRKQMRINKYLAATDSDDEDDCKYCKSKHQYDSRSKHHTQADDSDVLTIQDEEFKIKNEKPLKRQMDTIKELQDMIEDLKHDADRIGCQFQYSKHRKCRNY